LIRNAMTTSVYSLPPTIQRLSVRIRKKRSRAPTLSRSCSLCWAGPGHPTDGAQAEQAQAGQGDGVTGEVDFIRHPSLGPDIHCYGSSTPWPPKPPCCCTWPGSSSSSLEAGSHSNGEAEVMGHKGVAELHAAGPQNGSMKANHLVAHVETDEASG